MNIGLTGGSGFLGWNIIPRLTFHGYAVAAASSSPQFYKSTPEKPDFCLLDITNEASIRAFFDAQKPAILVHAAALSSPLEAERSPDKAQRLNVDATAMLLYYAGYFGVPLFFISTDLVFDGNNAPYTESVTPTPTIEYGRSKRAAEELLLTSTATDVLILRLSLLYGHLPSYINRFPQAAADDLNAGKNVVLFTDQYRTPLFAPDVGDILHQLLKSSTTKGLYHAGGGERFPRSDFVLRYLDAVSAPRSTLRLCSMEEIPSYTTKIADVSLDSSLLYGLIDFQPTPLSDGIQAILREAQQN